MTALEYAPVWKLCLKLFGYKPTPQTIRRWALGLNSDGKQLHCIKAGGSYRTTREALAEYMTVQPIGKQERVADSRPSSAKAKAKREAADAAYLDSAGV